MATLQVLSAGAAKGLVQVIEPQWTARAGTEVAGHFGAVGALKEEFLGGAACDVLILTEALLVELAQRGEIVRESMRPLGRVYTGIAVPAHARPPRIDTPDALRHVLHDASAIYFPDPHRATAGIHFARVLAQLGISDAVAARLRPYPHGGAAMRAMADAAEPGAVGCTQVTEILYTTGVTLVGKLPHAFELSTPYVAAVCTRATQVDAAREFIEALAGEAAAAHRQRGGFEPSA